MTKNKEFNEILEILRNNSIAFRPELMNWKKNYCVDYLVAVEENYRLARIIGRSIPEIEIVHIGFYFGETLVRNFKGAKWYVDDCLDIGDITVDIPLNNLESYKEYPFQKAHFCTGDSDENSMCATYFWLKDLTKIQKRRTGRKF